LETTSSVLNCTPCHIRHVRWSRATTSCDRCQRPAPRVWDVDRVAIDIDLDHPVVLCMSVSVHHCMACHHYVRLQPPFLRPGATYTTRVMDKAIQSVYRDGMAIRRVSRRLAADFWVQPSEAMIRQWCRVYTRGLDFAQDYQAWVIAEFSGVLCVDELYHGQLALLLAVDPAAPDGDRLVGYQLVHGSGQGAAVRGEEVERFLLRLRAAGVQPEVVITNRSPLYPALLAAIWPTAAHQLCLFHETRGVLDAAMEVVRGIRTGLPAIPAPPPRVRADDPRGKPDLRGRFRKDATAGADSCVRARQAVVARVHALHRQGYSDFKISQETGFRRVTIRKWLREAAPDGSASATDVPHGATLPTPWESWDQVRTVRALLKTRRYWLVRRPEHVTDDEKQDLERLYASLVGPSVRVVRSFVEGWYTLWRDEDGERRGVADALARYTAWRTNAAYAALPPPRRIQERYTEQEFSRLSPFLAYPSGEATNNGAERTARTVRHMQAPRFYCRTPQGIEGALVAHVFQQKAEHSAPPIPLGSRSPRGRPAPAPQPLGLAA